MSAGGAIGAVIGFIVGGPKGALYGYQIGSAAGSLLDPPKGPPGQNTSGPRLADLSVQTSTYGAVIPRGYGTFPVFGNVFWLENNQLKETAHVTSGGGGGGKGGGGSGGEWTQTTYTYSATFAVGLVEGPITGVRRIWVGSRLIYDAGASDIESLAANNDAASGFQVYLGTDTQQADPRMQATLGVADTPAYRGLAYIVFYDLELADYGNSLLGAQIKVEVVKAGTAAPVSFAVASVPAPSGNTGIGPGGYAWRTDGTQLARVHVPSGTVTVRRSILDSTGRTLVLAGYDSTGKMLCQRSGAGGYNILLPSGQLDEHTGAVSPGYTAGQAFGVSGFWVGPASTILRRFNGADGAYANFNSPVATSWALVNGNNALDGYVYFTYTIGSTVTLGRADPVNDSWEDLFVVPAGCSAPVIGGDGYFYFYNSTGVSKLDSSGTVLATSAALAGTPAYYGASGRVLAYRSATTTWTVLDAATLATIGSVVSATGAPDPDFFASGAGASGTSSVFLADSVINSSPALSTIVSAEALASGLLDAGDIDVTALTDSVRGYVVGSLTSLRSVLEPLQAAWPFDAVQSGYTIAFVKRGQTSVATIAAKLLDARAADAAPGVSIAVGREMDLVLPRRVTVKYFDATREYDEGMQYAERLNTDAVGVKNIDLALVLNATEAAGIAEKLLYLYWSERTDYKTALPPDYNALEPADVITIQAAAGDYEIRLTSITYTADGRLECQGKINRTALYTPAAIGEEGDSTGKVLSLSGDSVFLPLDLPALAISHNVPGFMTAMYGVTTGWNGGIVYRSDDGGQEWKAVQGFPAPASVAGYASTTLPDHRTDLFDKTNRLTVWVNGDLASVTELDVLNGSNHFAYGAHGRWEIIGVQNCVEQVDGSWILSNILRGRFGTEWACSQHATEDSIVLLSATAQKFIGQPLDALDLERTYRGVTAGKNVSTALDQAFTYQGANLECYAPVYLNGNRHPSTNDWTLEWIRRTRLGGDWRSYVDATLSETSESYEVDIYASGAYATLKRTLTASTPTVAYTSAQQVTDFGSNQSTLYVKVYQLSEHRGRGYPLTTSITR